MRVILFSMFVGISAWTVAGAADVPPEPAQYFRETWQNTSSLPLALVNDNAGRNFAITPAAQGTDNAWNVLFPALAMGTWQVGAVGDPLNSVALHHAEMPSGVPISDSSDAGYFRSMLSAPIVADDNWEYTIRFKQHFLSAGISNMPRTYIYLAADGGEATGDAGRPANGFGVMTFGRSVRPYPESFGALAVGSTETWIPCPEEDRLAQVGVLYEWTVTFSKDEAYTRIDYDIKRGGADYRAGAVFIGKTIPAGTALDRVVIMTRNRAHVSLDDITITAGPGPGIVPERPDCFARPTFHCIGLYWSPAAAGADHPFASVQYRKTGDSAWSDALPMRYNPIEGTDKDGAPYRGSIVALTPNTEYEIALSLDGTSETTSLTAKTWSEDFPIGAVVNVEPRTTPLVITESGTPEAYRLYDGTGLTIDMAHTYNNCIIVNASYVILRGFTLRGAGINDTEAGGGGHAILIQGGHKIVIENCDISDWGRPAVNPYMPGHGRNLDSAVYSSNAGVSHVIIQRCRMHHPTYDTNHWNEPAPNSHPSGPQCVSYYNTAGRHVIRYSEFYSDGDHMYNDGLGGGTNGSYDGYPGPDSDIYCNYVSHCWDNPIEPEGSDRNVRVWNNYITESYTPIANAPVSIGPLYIWRNVSGRSQKSPDDPSSRFLKMGFASSEDWMTGFTYIFHNTIFQPNGEGCEEGVGNSGRIIRHAITRNNVLYIRDAGGVSISANLRTTDNSFDYDLYNGIVPAGHQANGIKGIPIFAPGAGFNTPTMKGNFALSPSSPGYDAGEIIPNFSDGYVGAAPDMGAHEAGHTALEVGVNAVYRPAQLAVPASAGRSIILYD